MPRLNHTELICIIDESGSMERLKEESIDGFNSFLEEQRNEEGSTNITLYLFNTRYKLVFDNIPIQDTLPLNHRLYHPRGNTALLDTIGIAIDKTGVRLANTPEELRPEKVIVCILTDGLENSSRIFSKMDILNKIVHQTVKYNWSFVYLGANQDAFKEASELGISRKTTSDFVASKEGTKIGYKKLSTITSSEKKST